MLSAQARLVTRVRSANQSLSQTRLGGFAQRHGPGSEPASRHRLITGIGQRCQRQLPLVLGQREKWWTSAMVVVGHEVWAPAGYRRRCVCARVAAGTTGLT